jgi:hypothetical protein
MEYHGEATPSADFAEDCQMIISSEEMMQQRSDIHSIGPSKIAAVTAMPIWLSGTEFMWR